MLAYTDSCTNAPFRDNRNWLFDVIYDRRVPETRSLRVPIPVRPGAKPWIIEGERAEVRDHDERVLKTALEVVRRVLRDDSNASFRISRRGHRFIALHGDDGLIVPNLTQLSSGETALLNLFLSILRDFEAAGSARRSIGAPGHNDDRSRTPRHSRPPGRTSAVGALRRSPSPPFRREGTTATPHGNLDPIRRCPFLPSAALNARPFYPGNMGE